MYTKMRKSLKSKDSSRRRDKTPAPSPPPPATSVPPSQPDALSLMQGQVDSLNAMLHSMSEAFLSRLDALQASIGSSSLPESSSRPSHRPDGGAPQPGVTTDESRTFQAMVEPTRKTWKSSSSAQVSPPRQEFAFPSAASQPRDAPRPHPQPSAFVPPPPPRSEVPPQPSSSGWVPSGPPPPRSRGSRSSSESEASESESVAVSRDSALTRLAELLYEVCPHSRPLLDDTRPPQCEFEGWFGQPEASPARPHFRLYPRVAEVESEVTAKAGSLARRSKLLSSILTSCYHRHGVADLPNYASALAVNPSFSQLAGAKAVGSKRWGSISFSEMEKSERVFRSQLEMTSKSLWLLSGMLTMLKRDGFQPTDPAFLRPWPQPLRPCRSRRVPLLPAPRLCVRNAVTPFWRTRRFLCLSLSDAPLRCLLGRRPSSSTRRCWELLWLRCSNRRSFPQTWPCPGLWLGVEVVPPPLLL